MMMIGNDNLDRTPLRTPGALADASAEYQLQVEN
jgi:hypothetical protein